MKKLSTVRRIDYSEDYFDVVVFVFFISAVVLAFFVSTTYIDVDPVLSQKAIFQTVMGSLVVFRPVLSGARMARPIVFDDRLDRTESSTSVFMILVGTTALFFATGVILRLSPFLSLGAVQPSLDAEQTLTLGFLMVSGVSEELFFRGVLYPFFSRLFDVFEQRSFNFGISATITSLVFMVYHYGVYGTRWDYLGVVFVNSLLMCIVFELSRGFREIRGGRLSVPIIVHVLNNMIAAGVFDVLGADGIVGLVSVSAGAVVFGVLSDRGKKGYSGGPFLYVYSVISFFCVFLIVLPILTYSGLTVSPVNVSLASAVTAVIGVLYVKRMQSDMYEELRRDTFVGKR